MTELMHEHLAESGVVAGEDIDLVVDAASAIDVAVDKHDDMFEGHSGKHVVEAVYVLCHQVALAVEGVVVRAYGCEVPALPMWHTGSFAQ